MKPEQVKNTVYADAVITRVSAFVNHNANPTVAVRLKSEDPTFNSKVMYLSLNGGAKQITVRSLMDRGFTPADFDKPLNLPVVVRRQEGTDDDGTSRIELSFASNSDRALVAGLASEWDATYAAAVAAQAVRNAAAA